VEAQSRGQVHQWIRTDKVACMKIWIDLANSPQVLFFQPIIRELEQYGHETIITSRAFAQTIELADKAGLTHTPIGGHAGENGLLASLWVNFQRARQQLQFLADQPIDLAISHNAYAQAMAAFMRRLPFATTMDYEHQQGNHLPFRVARLVIVPEAFPNALLKRFGAKHVYKYPGVKEQIYLSDFTPDLAFRQKVGLDPEKIIVLLRPPATWALYHQGFENHLWGQIIEVLGRRADVTTVFLPRIPAQRTAIQQLNLPGLWIPDTVLDGPNLIWISDLVLSAGGTMNREAAVLGVPAYTIFAGKLGAVDQYLIDQGRLKVLENLEQLRVTKRVGAASPLLASGKELVTEVTKAFLSTV
jgi:uncharacterized protein